MYICVVIFNLLLSERNKSQDLSSNWCVKFSGAPGAKPTIRLFWFGFKSSQDITRTKAPRYYFSFSLTYLSVFPPSHPLFSLSLFPSLFHSLWFYFSQYLSFPFCLLLTLSVCLSLSFSFSTFSFIPLSIFLSCLSPLFSFLSHSLFTPVFSLLSSSFVSNCLCSLFFLFLVPLTHTHTHTHIYIYIYMYISILEMTSLMTSSLLLPKYLACLNYLTSMVCEMGDKWLYNCCFVGVLLPGSVLSST